ncbi:MAG: DUF2184 domain-containing protein [Pseudomonadota bacterium]|nr:DUF2184 domain-containing protein [Pseudomonadota bacterium]
MKTRFVQDGLSAAQEMGVFIGDDGTPMRLDTGETAFFERQLEAVEQRLYEKKLRELKYRRHIPVSNADGPGAASITYYLYTKTGMAKIIANPSDDLPRADVYASRHTAMVHSVGTSFGYSTRELRHAQFANVPLEMQKADSARRTIRERENEIAWTGDANYNIFGFLNNPNIPVQEMPLNAGATSRTWANKTPNEIIADVRLLVSGIRQTTNGVHEGNTMLLPIEQYDIIAETPRSDLSDTTILEFLTKPGNSFGLNEIDWLTELKGAGVGGTDMIAVYEKDPEVLEARIPMEMQNLPPQARNLEFLVPVEAENAGVVVRYPLACSFGYGI